ncbi:MAG: class I SAM-dependent methyltransferase, partial [Bacteroidia bacterium]
IIRSFKPQKIFEIGSGFSTRVMRLAVNHKSSTSDTNSKVPLPDVFVSPRIICIDPQPRVDILEHADEHFAFYVENLSSDVILNKIKSGDILFIDSSHLVATGGDVNYLFLEILPQLPVGVLIHIHDIFFPFDYPEEWVMTERWGWNEQYLVHAFLMFNDTFEITWPSHYMWTKNNQKLNKYFQPPVSNYKPSSLWIKKIK